MVGLRGAGTVSQVGGCVDFTLCYQCQALGQALVLCCQGRGDSVGCVVLLTRVTLPTLWIADQVRNDGHGHDTSTLWIPAYAGMTVSGWCCLVHPHL